MICLGFWGYNPTYPSLSKKETNDWKLQLDSLSLNY
jgi:hypothetical protein